MNKDQQQWQTIQRGVRGGVSQFRFLWLCYRCGGGEDDDRDSTPRWSESYEAAIGTRRDTSPLAATSDDDVTNDPALALSNDANATDSSTTLPSDVVSSVAPVQWTRASRVRRGMIRYRELDSDWGSIEAWAHTPTLTTSEENDANGPFSLRPRTMKMPLVGEFYYCTLKNQVIIAYNLFMPHNSYNFYGWLSVKGLN